MNQNSSSTEAVVDKLAADMKVVIEDSEELLRATAAQVGERVVAARVRIKESLEVAKGKLGQLREDGLVRAEQAARATDQFVHEEPWKAVGLGAAVGIILGILIARR